MATILIADDRPLNRQYLVTLLGYFGHRVIEASDGEEALKLARAERPQLVITDLVMPKIDGEELARRLGAEPELAAIPVILYSAAYSLGQAEAVARSVQAFGVLPKPSEPEVILEIVNRALGLSPSDVTSLPPVAATEGNRADGFMERGLAALEEVSQRLAALIEMSLELAAERDPERLLVGSAYMARKLIGARFAGIGVPDADAQTMRCFLSGSGNGTVERSGSPASDPSQAGSLRHAGTPAPGSMLDRLLAERRPVRSPSVTSEQLGASPPLWDGDRGVSFLGVPLRSATAPLGWLFIMDKLGKDEFTEEDERVAATLASQAAVACQRLEERRQAEEALQQSKSMFEALFESAPDGMVVADSTGKIVQVNSQVEKLFGYHRGELVGQPIEVLVPDRLRDAHSGHRQSYHKQPHLRPMGVGVELLAKRKDGTEFLAEIMLSPMQTEQGNRVLSVVRDITRRKEAEEHILRLNQELEQRVNELQEANQSLETFGFSVSHDLRAPLRAIEGFVRILIEDYGTRLDAEGQRVLNVISASSQKMGRLIEDLLAFFRLSRAEIQKSNMDMTALAQSVLEELQASEPSRQVAITVQPMTPANGDPAMLCQIYTNLISNAWKFTRHVPHAAIEIGAYRNEEQNVYFVKDNGAGFDVQYAHKLFGVFQRLHPDQEFEGTGIGLALVRRIIQRHGGQVWASGKVGEGATFYFTV